MPGAGTKMKNLHYKILNKITPVTCEYRRRGCINYQ